MSLMIARPLAKFLPTPLVRTARICLGWGLRLPIWCSLALKDKLGLEIGGPSTAFQDRGILPIYRYALRVDNCVFASDTVWEGKRPEGKVFEFYPGKPCGFNFIREATNLYGISNSSYDFVLSSHSLEHTANPISALTEWRRVTRPGGLFIIVLPHYRYTFDHRRTPTPIQHMLDDHLHGTDESDQTHVEEILRLHDLSMDKPAGNFAQFHSRSLRNLENRCLHHHVFNEHNSRELVEAAGLNVKFIRFCKPCNIVILASRPAPVRGENE